MSSDLLEFVEFPKLARLSRECVITEKIDGTNAQIVVTDDGRVIAGSRNRFLTPESDNCGFARWVAEHAEELTRLGPGRHFGEWWGAGIQRRYGLSEKRFSLFNTHRWGPTGQCTPPACCSVVPVLAIKTVFSSELVDEMIEYLRTYGSVAAPGFMNPEGVVVYHTAAQISFKKTLEGDESPKSKLA